MVAEDKSLRIMPTMKTVQSAVLVLFLGSLGVTADRELDPFAGGGFFDDDAKGGGISKRVFQVSKGGKNKALLLKIYNLVKRQEDQITPRDVVREHVVGFKVLHPITPRTLVVEVDDGTEQPLGGEDLDPFSGGGDVIDDPFAGDDDPFGSSRGLDALSNEIASPPRGPGLKKKSRHVLLLKEQWEKRLATGDTFAVAVRRSKNTKSAAVPGEGRKSYGVITQIDTSDVEAEVEAPFTKDRFVKELKGNKIWVVEDVEKCGTCNGSGRVKSVQGTRDCNGCSGGERTIAYVVKW